jgi:Trypsin-like peptidase domain
MKNLILFASLFSACSAFAGEILTPQEIHSPGLGLNAPVVSRLEQTVLKMNNASSDSYCTAFPVTADGYLLTALHCLRDCLVSQDLAEQASNSALGLNDLLVVKKSSLVNKTCPGLSIPQIGASVVRVVATGPAIAQYDAHFTSEYSGLFAELKTKSWHLQANDFALLKVETTKPLSCLRFGARPAPHQEIWAVGYPQAKDGSNTQLGPKLGASRGRTYADVEESRTYREQPDQISKDWVRTRSGQKSAIFASASNNFGQSGGPVVDARGRVVGIVSGFAVPPGKDHVEMHELMAGSLGHVLRSLDSRIANEVATKNVFCAAY